jgi:hypothetical protein
MHRERTHGASGVRPRTDDPSLKSACANVVLRCRRILTFANGRRMGAYTFIRAPGENLKKTSAIHVRIDHHPNV